MVYALKNMASVDPLLQDPASIALPGIGRALVAAGKLGQRSAEELYRKALADKSSFIAELVGGGAVSPADLAHTLSAALALLVVRLFCVVGGLRSQAA